MTKISQYSTDVNITGNDKWIGSDAQNFLITKNFTPNNLANFFNGNNVIDIGTSIRYRYQTLLPGEAREQGTISFETEIGPQVNFSAITTFLIAKNTLKGNTVSQYLDFLVDGKVLLSKASNINIFGYYKITSIEPWIPNTNFFVVEVDFLAGNGFIYEDLDYLVSLVDKVQDVPPPVWGSITGDIEDQTDLINYISSQITTPTLAEVLAEGNTTGGENIVINDADAIQLENSSTLKKGTYDFGADGGISRICGVGFEDMWQSGIRHVFDSNGLIRNSTNGFNIVPDASFDNTLRFKVDSLWTLDNGDTYKCTDASTGAAVWELVNTGTTPTLQEVTDEGNTITGVISIITLGDDNVTVSDINQPEFGSGISAYGLFANGDISQTNYGYNNIYHLDEVTAKHLQINYPASIVSTNKVQTFQDADGTIALTSDIPDVTLQNAYDNSTNGTIILDATRGNIKVKSISGITKSMSFFDPLDNEVLTFHSETSGSNIKRISANNNGFYVDSGSNIQGNDLFVRDIYPTESVYLGNNKSLVSYLNPLSNHYFKGTSGVKWESDVKIEYAADYSALYSNRSLIDKGYADATYMPISSTGGGIPHATAAGTDTYTATVTGVTAYNDADAYLIRFTNGNTTGATLNINSLGAIPLYRNNDGPLLGGDILAGGEMLCIYNSTTNRFQVIGISPNSLIAYVTNDDSVTLTKGMPVYAFSGTGDRMTVKRANNTGDATSAQTVGLVLSTSIAVNQKGVIMMQGLLDGLSILPTATWDDGDPVYLGATPGTITNIKPYAPNHLVYLGVVTTSSNGAAGRMYVRVQNGYELQELHNVDALNPNNNDGIFYNSITQLWEHKNVLAVAAERRNANNSTNSNINYCGIAPADSLESASVWIITRLTITLAGAVTTASAINVKWTDRETATYT